MDTPKDIDFKRTNDITIEEVKACSIFAHLTDEEALEVIETLKLFTKIAYDVYKKTVNREEIPSKNRILKA